MTEQFIEQVRKYRDQRKQQEDWEEKLTKTVTVDTCSFTLLINY